MNENDLIRRGDAIRAIKDRIYANREGATQAYKASVRMEDIAIIEKVPAVGEKNEKKAVD